MAKAKAVGFKVASLINWRVLGAGARVTVWRWGVERVEGGEGITWEVRAANGAPLSPWQQREVLAVFWALERLGTEDAVGTRWTASGRKWRKALQARRAGKKVA